MAMWVWGKEGRDENEREGEMMGGDRERERESKGALVDIQGNSLEPSSF